MGSSNGQAAPPAIPDREIRARQPNRWPAMQLRVPRVQPFEIGVQEYQDYIRAAGLSGEDGERHDYRSARLCQPHRARGQGGDATSVAFVEIIAVEPLQRIGRHPANPDAVPDHLLRATRRTTCVRVGSRQSRIGTSWLTPQAGTDQTMDDRRVRLGTHMRRVRRQLSGSELTGIHTSGKSPEMECYKSMPTRSLPPRQGKCRTGGPVRSILPHR